MTCKYCSRDLPADAIFCCYCGERVARKRREKKAEVSVPDPKQLPSGTWFVQVMVDGKRVSISAPTEKDCREKARATKAGMIEAKSKTKHSLDSVVRAYIDANEGTLSPSTIRGYEVVYKNRFKAYMSKDIATINFQQMVSDEAKEKSPKTVSNAWALVRVALEAIDFPIPKVNLPKQKKYEGDWLDFKQIDTFLGAIRDTPIELACILALHSLRDSELRALTAADIYDDKIHVRGAIVPDKNNVLVRKETNKNATSTRDVPVLIPRLYELLPADGPLVTIHPSSLRKSLERACARAKLPVCSVHDLRRSFASLAYHLKWNDRTTMELGGWSTMDTVRAVYEKLSDADKQKDVKKMQSYYRKNANKITNKS